METSRTVQGNSRESHRMLIDGVRDPARPAIAMIKRTEAQVGCDKKSDKELSLQP